MTNLIIPSTTKAAVKSRRSRRKVGGKEIGILKKTKKHYLAKYNIIFHTIF